MTREHSLAESERNYREIFNATNEAIFVHDAKTGAILDLNDTALSMFGYTREEAIGLSLNDFSLGEPPYSEKEANEKIRLAVTAGPQTFEWRCRRKNGELFWSAVVLRPSIIGGQERVLAAALDITERKRAEESLRDSEMRYHSLFDHANDAIFLMKDVHFVECNPKTLAMFGCSREQIIGARPHDFSPDIQPDGIASDEKAMEKVTAALEGRPQFFEWLHCRLDKTLFHAEVSLNHLKLGSEDYLLAIVRDVTERVRAKAALEASEAMLKAQFDNSPDVIFVIDRQMRFLRLNRLLLSNLRVEDLIGTNCLERIPPRERPFAQEKIEACFNSGVLQEFQHEMDGGHWRHVRIAPLPPAGDVQQIMVISTDITEQKLAEAELRRLATIVEQAAEYVIVTDTEAVITYVNPAFEKGMGYSREDVIGRDEQFLLGNELSLSCFREMREALKGGEVWSGHLTNRRNDGRTVEVEATVSPIRAPSGDLSGFVSIERDVSRETELESQLRQAQKMEAIGTLAGGIAHDFNNILSAIIGNAEIAMLDELPEGHPARYSVQQVLNASGRAKELVKQILTFSRQREGEVRVIGVNEIAGEVSRLLRASVSSNIAIELELRAKDDRILGDPSQIHQILMNLCTNAAHAMLRTGGRLRLTTSNINIEEQTEGMLETLNPGRYLKLTVEDTGHGMSREIAERVFEPYFTTKQVGEGTGLGLAVVHGIVKRMHGQISVESEEGKGSVFTVLVPTVENRGDEEESEEGPIPGGAERVLFVDDEEILLDVGKRILESMGYAVTTAGDSLVALDIFRADPTAFDLVITDMNMPNMTGDVLASELIAIRSDIPIIVCTGFSELIDEKGAKAIGIRELLMKPLVRRQVAESIRRALGVAARL